MKVKFMLVAGGWVALGFCGLAGRALAQTEATPPESTTAGPTLEMPDSTDTAASAEGPRDTDLDRGLQDYRFRTAQATSLGGYGELHYNLSFGEDFAAHQAQIDLHRLVLFVAHNFDETIRFYGEIEVEHAFVSMGAPGEVGIEQAFVDYKLRGDALGLRAGIVLVPVGIINQWHEPPLFHGVERPRVDNRILPTTWREGGIGLFGRLGERLRYEAYLVGGLSAAGFRASSAIRGGRRSVAEAPARGPALTARIEFEPRLGMVAGLSGYWGLAGPNATLFGAPSAPGLSDGPRLALSVPVGLVALDARVRWRGLEARLLGAWGSVGDSGALSQAFTSPDGTGAVGAVGASFYGAYAEVAYDVLRPLRRTDQQLLAFARVEHWDTTASTESGVTDDPAVEATDVVVGLTYRPIRQVVFKADYIRRVAGGTVPAGNIVSLGTGFMF